MCVGAPTCVPGPLCVHLGFLASRLLGFLEGCLLYTPINQTTRCFPQITLALSSMVGHKGVPSMPFGCLWTLVHRTHALSAGDPSREDCWVSVSFLKQVHTGGIIIVSWSRLHPVQCYLSVYYTRKCESWIPSQFSETNSSYWCSCSILLQGWVDHEAKSLKSPPPPLPLPPPPTPSTSLKYPLYGNIRVSGDHSSIRGMVTMVMCS